MALALLAALLVQQDPKIESVERITGDVARPGLWSPLVVTLSSATGYSGDLVARSALGFDVAVSVEVARGGNVRVILPSLDPVEVIAGSTREVVAFGASAEFLVAVDSRLPYAGSLESGKRVAYRVIDAADLGPLLSSGLMEAFDGLLLSSDEGLSLDVYETTGLWAVAPERGDAASMVSRLQPGCAAVLGVDREPQAIWALAPQGGWVEAKREWTALFAILYALAAFLALVFLARWRPRWTPAIAVGLAAVFAGVFFVRFPRGQLWVVAYACEVARETSGRSAEWRAWFVGAAADLETNVEFPRLVKPVFPGSRGAASPFTIRVGGRGCRVEGLALDAGTSACFAGADLGGGAWSKTMLRRTTVVRDGRKKFLGDVAYGAGAFPETVAEDGPAPREADFHALGRRFVRGDTAIAWMGSQIEPARDVTSPDLADARRHPTLLILELAK